MGGMKTLSVKLPEPLAAGRIGKTPLNIEHSSIR